MKLRLILATLMALNAGHAFGATPGPGCAAKQADIEASIAAATARGNQQELAGLNQALRATKAHCTEAALQKQKDARVRKAQKELAQREQDLVRAEKTGDAEKIEKRRAKAEDARRELAEAQKP